MSHKITVEYLRAALMEIAKAEGPYKRDPLAFAESVIAAQQQIANAALNGEWDSPADLGPPRVARPTPPATGAPE